MRVVTCPKCGSVSVDGIERRVNAWPNPTVDFARFRCRFCENEWMHDYIWLAAKKEEARRTGPPE